MHEFVLASKQYNSSLFDYESLEKLVNQNSQSANCSGVNLVQLHLANLLSNIGFENKFYENEFFNSGNLLVGTLKGNTNFTISTIGHADTVIGPENNNFRHVNNRMYGAGIADNKSGQLIAIGGIKYYLEKKQNPNISFNFISSPNEEVGSPGFQEKLSSLGVESDLCIGFEPALPDGSIISSRKGNYWIEITVNGESFHSGRAAKGHMNGAMDLCRTLVNLESEFLGHSDITMNIGTISGGNSINTICESASALIDFRFSTFDSLDYIKSKIERLEDNFRICRVHNKKASLNIRTLDLCPPMDKNSKAQGFLELYKNIAGIEADVHCGGAADINHLSSKESVCFDGFGAVADFMHLSKEYVEVSSLELKAESFGRFLIILDESLVEKKIN